MKRFAKFGSVFIALLLVLSLFAVGGVNAASDYTATFKATLNGNVPAGCRFEIDVKGYVMDESNADAEPISTEKITIDTDEAQTVVYSFKQNEVETGGIYYQFSVAKTGNDLIVEDGRVITVYLCGPDLIKTSDNKVEGEVEYDIENGLSLDFEFECVNLTSVSVELVKDNPISKVYDGTTAVLLSEQNYKLKGVAEGHDVKLAFTEGSFNDANVKKANKVTLKGLSLVGADASKYKLTDTKLEGKAKITPRPITVTADTIMMTKGTIEPQLTYQLSEPIIEGNEIIGVLARTSGNDIGEYAVTRGTLDLGTNYEVTFVDGKLIISSFTLTEATDTATSIKVSGYFDKGSSISVDVLNENSAAYNYMKPSAAWGKIIYACDISFNAVAYDGSLTVKIPVDPKYEGKEIAVYQQMENGAIMTYKLTVNGCMVSFVTDECSQFMLVADKDPVKEESTSVILTILKVLLILILIVIGIVLVIALFFFGMVFFNKTEQLKKIIKMIKRLLNKK